MLLVHIKPQQQHDWPHGGEISLPFGGWGCLIKKSHDFCLTLLPKTQGFTDLKWPFKLQFSTHVHWSCHSTLDPPHPTVSRRVYSCAVPSAWSAPSSTPSSLVFSYCRYPAPSRIQLSCHLLCEASANFSS